MFAKLVTVMSVNETLTYIKIQSIFNALRSISFIVQEHNSFRSLIARSQQCLCIQLFFCRKKFESKLSTLHKKLSFCLFMSKKQKIQKLAKNVFLAKQNLLILDKKTNLGFDHNNYLQTKFHFHLKLNFEQKIEYIRRESALLLIFNS